MRDEAHRQIGHLYPKVQLPDEYGGGEATVIAWLWARTVTCPNPACSAEMPLVRSFWLSKKKGREAWVEPVVDKNRNPAKVRFEVRHGTGKPRDGTVNRQGARCIVCGAPVPFEYVRKQGKEVGLGANLMAVVAEGKSGRAYLEPDEEQVRISKKAKPSWVPDSYLPEKALGFRVQLYGMNKHADLFTPRQLVALTTFSDLVGEAREKVFADAKQAGLPDDGRGLEAGGTGAHAYAEAVATYLAFAVDRSADYNSAISSWSTTRQTIRNTFSRQAIPMVWDYAECNIFSISTGNFLGAIEWIIKVIHTFPAIAEGFVTQLNAKDLNTNNFNYLFSTDPPYYDNIGYADLSDFFYIWLRRSLKNIYPSIFKTMLVPKEQELVATPYRFNGNKSEAKSFFEMGLKEAFKKISEMQNHNYPLTIYYAFKQQESNEDNDNGLFSVTSTGWETMLEALLKDGFTIIGTWPFRTELVNRPISIGTNALASSIVLVCRKRSESASTITRRDFIKELKVELPPALRMLQKGNIAPVDLAQSVIGPGMSVFSRYEKVLEADGTAMTVRMALSLINQVLDDVLAEQEGEFDPDTRWALAWFQQFGMNEGPFGDAETLSKAKNVSVQGLVEAGILTARGGKARLIPREGLLEDWDPSRDTRLTVWEMTQYLIRALEKGGEEKASELLRKLGLRGEAARDLTYRLYSICDRKNRTREALAYNTLITSWPEIARLALRSTPESPQPDLGF